MVEVFQTYKTHSGFMTLDRPSAALEISQVGSGEAGIDQVPCDVSMIPKLEYSRRVHAVRCPRFARGLESRQLRRNGLCICQCARKRLALPVRRLTLEVFQNPRRQVVGYYRTRGTHAGLTSYIC